jgi:hypothetical protein
MVGTLVCGFVAAHWWLARRWGSAAANNIVSLAANLWFVAAGAAGVGRAPTQAVVIGSLMILISNFFLSFFLNIFFPAGTY